MDAWILAGASGLSLLSLALTFKTSGALFSFLGGNLAIYLEGSLMVTPTVTINGGSPAGCGTTGNPICGYSFAAADVILVTLLVAILAITCFVVALNTYWADDRGIQAHK